MADDWKYLEKMAKLANQRLRQLEKSGAADISSAYRELKLRAYDRREGMTITKTYVDKKTGQVKGGNIAFRRDFSKMTTAELGEVTEALEEFMSYKTTTVRAARKAMEQSFEEYQRRAAEKKAGVESEETRGKKYFDLNRSQYKALWTSSATKAFGYEKVFALAKKIEKRIKKRLEGQEGDIDQNVYDYLDKALAGKIDEQINLKEQISEAKLASVVEDSLKRRRRK